MKKGKKILACVLSTVVVAASISFGGSAVLADEEAKNDAAVNSMEYSVSDWAKAEVSEAENNGLIPDVLLTADLTDNITRAEFAAIAVRLYEQVSGDNEVCSENPFDDVEDGEYAINKAYNLGITNGMTENTFEPDLPISREQLATMLCRVFKTIAFDGWTLENDGEYYLNYDIKEAGFADHDDISEYALPSVYFMTYHGIINGMGNGLFVPMPENGDGYATREQSVLMSLRCFKNLFGDEVIAGARADVSSFKGAYREYVKKNIMEAGHDGGVFAQGMILCDLDEDGIAELFSLAYEGDGGDLSMRFHRYRDGKVFVNEDGVPETFVDFDMLIRPAAYYENARDFFGVYRNKATGRLALINSVSDTDGRDRFDIVTYDGENMLVEDKGVKEMSGNRWNIDGRRSEVMKNYELVENGYYADAPLRGMYAMYTLSVALDSIETGLEELEAEYKPVYDEASDGEVFCYVRNVDLEQREIELVPMTTITYEQYTNAISSDGLVELDGDLFKIQHNGQLTEDTGLLTLFELPMHEYSFYEPTAQQPVSVIHNLRRKAPVKVKMSEKIEFVTEASAEACLMDVDEYFNDYANNYNGNYYKASIADKEVVGLTLIYRP